MKHSIKIPLMALVALMAVSTTASAQLGNLLNKAKDAAKATPSEVQFMCNGKIWGPFNPKENKFTRIKDGNVQYTRTMLENGDIMTDKNERWGNLDETGRLLGAETSDWSYYRKDISNGMDFRRAYAYIRFSNFYRVRRYMIYQGYQVGPEDKDESYGVLGADKLRGAIEMWPVYK